jgi:transcriptional regulator with XRE-family HTH domain
MKLREIVARNLRRMRRGRELSQEELALRAGFDRNYVGMLERCENSPTVDTLERLAQALNVDPQFFMVRALQTSSRDVEGSEILAHQIEPFIRR